MDYLLAAGNFNVALYWCGAVLYGYLWIRLHKVKDGVGLNLLKWSNVALFVACVSWGVLRTALSCQLLTIEWVCALMTFPLAFVISIGLYLIAAVHRMTKG